jgi:argininosuccinate synthase
MEIPVSKDQSPIILAFSGGLDTSFCVPWLKENYDRDVITACVDTGGIDADAAVALEERALALGAIEHILIDAKEAFFDTVIRHLIAGNVLRGNAYPLCVGAERGLQAEKLALLAKARRATTVAMTNSLTCSKTICRCRHKAPPTPSIVASGASRSAVRKR